MTNRTRQALSGAIRAYINEPDSSDSFISDTTIGNVMSEVYKKWNAVYHEREPDAQVSSVEFAYPASTAVLELIGAGHVTGYVDSVTSVMVKHTDGSYTPMEKATSTSQIKNIDRAGGDNLSSQPSHWFVENHTSWSAGVGTHQVQLYLAPTPASSVDIIVLYHIEDQEFDSDTDTTGWPTILEHLLIWDTIREIAIIDRDKTLLAMASQRLEEFRVEFHKQVGGQGFGISMEVEYEEDLND